MRKFFLMRNLMVGILTAAAAQAAPVHLRCEYRENPIGIDATTPHFSWQSNNSERNWRQSAYQIMVASTADNLKSGNADVWDSAKQSSSESVGIAYRGPQLQARKRYYWTVRVWDSNGQQFQSAEAAWWEMGLQKSDWTGKWITRKNPDDDADRAKVRWIWAAGQNALNATPKSVVVFHREIKLREKPKDAALLLLARGDFKAEVNGHQVGAKHGWHEFDREDITHELKLGSNSIDVTVTVAEPNPFGPDAGAKTSRAALAGLLKITRANGSILRTSTDASWKSRLQDQSGWKNSAVLAELGDQRFGSVPPLPQPATLLRHSFDVSK